MVRQWEVPGRNTAPLPSSGGPALAHSTPRDSGGHSALLDSAQALMVFHVATVTLLQCV